VYDFDGLMPAASKHGRDKVIGRLKNYN